MNKQDPDGIPAQTSLCKTEEKATVILKVYEKSAGLTQHSEHQPRF